MSVFVDRARVVLKAGDGGRGVISFRREAHVPRGGPDGGNGGPGGDVVLRVDDGVTTLADLRFGRTRRAEPGADGAGKDRSGASGADLVLRVPAGTLVRDATSGATIADLTASGEEIVVARGGAGGRGNARFATSTRRAPRIAEAGGRGEERTLELELKLLADVGLVGLPNAGKSTLLAALTRAKPKIAAYPFTTLSPNLGVSRLDERELVVADIPGLIEGAHAGAGLGEEFLRHVERTRLLVHVVDAAAPDPAADMAIIDRELAAYGHGLAERQRIVALNKLDLPEARDAVPALRAKLGAVAVAISAASGGGVPELQKRIFAACPPRATITAAPAVRRIAFGGTGQEWEVAREGDAFRLHGDRLERLAAGIDWDDPDAAAYFERVLVRTGVDRALRERGVREGDTVRVGRLELEWREAPEA